MGKIQRQIEELRKKVVAESAETVARFREVQHQMEDLFAALRQAAEEQADQNVQNLDTLLDIVVQEQAVRRAWEERNSQRTDKLEQRMTVVENTLGIAS